MRIEKIELTGFKSFSEKTAITFHPGITCIVGPNGCGKSNIVDAFRWVLGEQSARTLRGDKMEEVIFNGSQTRKPRGMSEVTLYLSFPEDGNGQEGGKTITVSRQLYRSGESEYLINRQSCRLKDIREMFLDTGLEMKSYSVLEQGRIGEIINAKPQDRRFLIEEVAGIMKYKVRKAEAQSKLESSRISLQRVSDIISEVKRHLNSIDRQVKKAERYKALSESLKEVELSISRRDYIRMTGRLSELNSTLGALLSEEAGRRSVITELEAGIQQKKLNLIEKEKEIEGISGELQAIERTISDLERQIAVYRSDIQHMNNTIISLGRQSEETDDLLNRKRERLDEISGKDSHIQSVIDSLKETLSHEEVYISEKEEEIFSLEEDIDEKRKELFRVTDSIGAFRNELNRLELTHEGLLRRASASERESEEAKRRITELDDGLKGVEGEIQSMRETLDELHDRRTSINDELLNRKRELEELRHKKAGMREEIASLEARVKSQNEHVTGKLERDMVVQAGIGLMATLSEVIDVEQRYEKAVEAALSDKIKGFIVSSRDDLRRAVDLINRNSLPRTAFMLSENRGKEAPGEAESTPEGAVHLYQFLRNEDAYSSLIRTLLDGYLLVDTLESAFMTMDGLDDLKPHTRMVTLNGEVIEPGGTVICGSGPNILRLKREIRELEGIIREKREALSGIERTISGHEETIEKAKNSLRDLEAGIVSNEKEITLLQASLNRLSEEWERFEKKLEFLSLELEELGRETSAVESGISAKREDLSSREALKMSVESGLNTLQEELSLRRSEIDSRRHAITDVKVELNSYKERLNSINTERETLGDEIKELTGRKEHLIEETERNRRVIEEKEADVESLEAKLVEKVSSANTLRQTVSEKRELISEVREGIMAEEELLKKERTALELLSKDIHEKEMLKTELSLRLSALCSGIMERYQIDIGEADIPVAEDEEGDLAHANDLKEKLQAIGPVNLGALDEHQDLIVRHEFLKTQHTDIVQSIDELEEAISRINRTTRKRLKEAFDSLNLKFNEVFRILFGGGTAELRLTDENNILESGIDIIVQPPGKRLQNLNLLSGGEKALAALSLLFAGFLLKPSPLCILDEADAPLDESNTERFKAMLKDLSRNIQFIVITHNRLTMEGADYLYGITMEEAGVSKVLSMEFV